MYSSLNQKITFSEYPNLGKLLQCPICFEIFQKFGKAPKIACSSEQHTICSKCLDDMERKRVQSGMKPECPLCRKQISKPYRTNQTFFELLSLRASQLQLRSQKGDLQIKVNRYEKSLKEKDQTLAQVQKKLRVTENEFQAMKMLMNELKQKQGAQNRPKNLNSFTDDEEKSQICNEERGKFCELGDPDKKPPLKWFSDSMTNETQLSLTQGNYTVTQIEFMLMYDTTVLIELNLSMNKIGNQGFKILVEKGDMPALRSLKVRNNNITEMPNMRKVCNLQELDLSNVSGQDKEGLNVFKEDAMSKLLDERWENLKDLGLQLENDRIWDNQDLMTRLVAQLSVISRINLSQTCSKITKKKCGFVTSMLNNKAKRPNHNRIRVLN